MKLFSKHFKEIRKSIRYSTFASFRFNSFAGKELNRQATWDQLVSLSKKLGGDVYFSDSIFTWGRIIGWIRDKKFQDSCEISKPSLHDNGVDASISWRTHTACWAASQACMTNGDFFEFGCHMGYTACTVRAFVNTRFKEIQPKRKYFWFDMFNTGMGGANKSKMIDQSESESNARKRSNLFPDIIIAKGNIVETYVNNTFFDNRKISFAHFDLNDYEVEMSVIRKATKNSGKGTVFLFDDFAMCPFHDQNKNYRDFFRNLGLEVLELPTGQGLVIF